MLLDYEAQMFAELLADDGLLIAARGLGLLRLISALVQIHCDPASLLLVINATPLELEILQEAAFKAGVNHQPQAITNHTAAPDRQQRYLDGGVFFVTSRILVVDILKDILPTHLVKGAVVCNAHRVDETSLEAFALRLYRERNKTGFVKAFSEYPHLFTSGFCQVEKIMQNTFVEKLFLWPRFHATIALCLEKHQPEVIELHQKMTGQMVRIQAALIDLLHKCLQELKRASPSVDADVFTVESALGRNFDGILRNHLDPISHNLTATSRRLGGDISTLRHLMSCLTQYDSVTFYHTLLSLRNAAATSSHQAGWLLLDAADALFTHAKDRVYGQQKPDKSKQAAPERHASKASASAKPASTASSFSDISELTLEQNSKWQLLSDVLEEIEEANRTSEKKDAPSSPSRTLIVTSDTRSCALIKQYLSLGGRQLMENLFKKHLQPKVGRDNPAPAPGGGRFGGQRWPKRKASAPSNDSSKVPKKPAATSNTAAAKPTGRGRGRGGVSATSRASRRTSRAAATKPASDDSTSDKGATAVGGVDNADDDTEVLDGESRAAGDDVQADEEFGVVTEPLVVVYPLRGYSDSPSAGRVIEDIAPRFIVLFDVEMEFVRQIEVFKASRPGVPLRVYFLMFSSSIEEQRYLTSLRKEKNAFELLIRQKATMVIAEDQSARAADSAALSRDPRSAAESVVSTRKAGGRNKESGPRKVVVDMREFRSSLPSLIHRRGIDIEPVTLEVGDYILSPDMCVERKSVSDLIGSLNSGRLFNQATAMTRHYRKPMLLVEFTEKQSFSLQAKGTLQGEISYQDLTSKLALLTLHFPKLRILWCQSPYATAELFDELKNNQPEPDAEAAAEIGGEKGVVSADGSQFFPLTQDFVTKLPGVNATNAHFILRNVANLEELASLTKQELSSVLHHPGHAQQLYDFLHNPPPTT